MRRVVFIAVPPIQIIELASSITSGAISSSCGLTLSGARHYRSLRGPIDTIFLPGGDGAETLACDDAFLGWLSEMAKRVRRVCSICTGTFLLGAAGLLSQRAVDIARDLVIFLRRLGAQAQFSVMLAALAARCRMSPRHFARVFAEERGVTPARFVEQTRVEAARILLQSTEYGLKEVACRSGFGSADSMRRAFLRVLSVAPGKYAERFHPASGLPG